jgi:hypothetical protein
VQLRHPSCHIGAGVEVEYFDGKLTLRCNKCQKFVAEIAVASQP